VFECDYSMPFRIKNIATGLFLANSYHDGRLVLTKDGN
jgi:hypothetical protein